MQQQTLVLWGEQDQALSAQLLLTHLIEHVPNVRIQRFEHAGHWVHRDVPETVTGHVVEFLRATGPDQS